MKQLVEEFTRPFKSGDTTKQLIFINVIFFLLVGVGGSILRLFGFPIFEKLMLSVLAMPSKLHNLAFKPWTLFTHMFLHAQLFHLLGNVVILYFAGQLFCGYLGNKRILTVYILGGLSGAVLFLLAYNTLPFFASMKESSSISLGASAATISLLVAIATYAPNIEVKLFLVLDVKLKYIAMLLVLVSLLGVDDGNAGGNISHIGGAVFGFIYITRLKSNKEFGRFVPNVITAIASYFERKPKVVYTDFKNKVRNDDMYNTLKKTNQAAIDAILDKISKSGYDSLSKEEKEILFKASKS